MYITKINPCLLSKPCVCNYKQSDYSQFWHHDIKNIVSQNFHAAVKQMYLLYLLGVYVY